jgi:hypothetical protein
MQKEAGMKIPERLKVGGVTYEVRVVPEIIDSQNLIGRTNHDNLIIEVQGALADDAAKKCFLHEMFHAIDEHTGVNQRGAPDEGDVDALVNALYMVMQDNPDMFTA